MEGFDYSDEQTDALINSIYDQITNLKNLPKNLYKQTARSLNKALYKGYGGTILEFKLGEPDYELLKELRENIYIFSGAKTATQVDEISKLMYNGDDILSLPDFKKKALVMFKEYNSTYLESEWITAQTSATSAKNWQYTEENKELFTRLKSVAIIDQYTAPECYRMNGVVASVDDPIWNHNLSPRHWRCRCHEERLDKYDTEPSTHQNKVKGIIKKNNEDMAPEFKMNAGKDRVIFDEKHQYFDIAKRNPGLAKRNFNLPIPNKDGV